MERWVVRTWKRTACTIFQTRNVDRNGQEIRELRTGNIGGAEWVSRLGRHGRQTVQWCGKT